MHLTRSAFVRSFLPLQAIVGERGDHQCAQTSARQHEGS